MRVQERARVDQWELLAVSCQGGRVIPTRANEAGQNELAELGRLAAATPGDHAAVKGWCVQQTSDCVEPWNFDLRCFIWHTFGLPRNPL